MTILEWIIAKIPELYDEHKYICMNFTPIHRKTDYLSQISGDMMYNSTVFLTLFKFSIQFQTFDFEQNSSFGNAHVKILYVFSILFMPFPVRLNLRELFENWNKNWKLKKTQYSIPNSRCFLYWYRNL